MAIVEARALTVARGRRIVLRDVDLTMRAGDVVRVAGANGSGKTSLLRVLAGLARPRHGELRREGTCAFVPERIQLAPALRPLEWLGAMRRLRGLDAVDWSAAATASGLDPAKLARPAATLSNGMLQRVALLEALHARPALLLLDEPFSGLDTVGREWLQEQLASGAPAALRSPSTTQRCLGGVPSATVHCQYGNERDRRRRTASTHVVAVVTVIISW